MQSGWWIAGCSSAFLTVGLGAFGAHALRAKVKPEMLKVWETGVTYQMFHSLGILIAAKAVGNSKKTNWPAALFGAGIILFSGSLYALVLTDISKLGILTPFGGLCFMAGWGALALKS
uniref:DUF423 domain-containing protein n=1 Tax=Chromera velia CCMP2878 TaxID=1169474 RepID=A0A0G4H634_9ALVE|mmetsp:Transcript_34887/g.68876  ORF Transcript_34887/g.68876 Transcript_34887/m.68876 type:complete len:118 (+) Transcript_34887:162-515(+)|eukprot:Cvel_5749.t1-p1 / transcript=Cvel_5749.t1 / gene=Cvel_5749 / organism=Chromera_velia_CCMP2878 / gene_product=UPF0382 membrane protein SACOL0629, putative / transcript_product=UPF0382 membrane protein SACOL0629, putative / location=Cvel_scaffold273:4224-5766(+) / protein_length=117 / sequence_SO=supercontig / SO=protein_coding / is_pseudo=false